MKTRHKIISALAAVVLLAAVSVILVALPRPESAATVAPAPGTAEASADLPAAAASLEAIQLSFRDIARRVLPVVVEIDVTEMNLGNIRKVSDVVLPAGVVVELEPNLTLVSCATPTQAKPEATEGEEEAAAELVAACVDKEPLPNLTMVRYADEQLDRKGRLLAVAKNFERLGGLLARSAPKD